jgi:hypothetical protein
MKKGNVFSFYGANDVLAGKVCIKPSKLIFTPSQKLTIESVGVAAIGLLKHHKVPVVLKVGSDQMTIPYRKDILAQHITDCLEYKQR